MHRKQTCGSVRSVYQHRRDRQRLGRKLLRQCTSTTMCGNDRKAVPATASIKAVGGLDGVTCPTEVNCHKHRQTLTSQRCCQAPTKMVRSQAAGLQYTAHGQYDCRCSRQGLNHPPLLERNMVNPTSRRVERQTFRKGRPRNGGQRNAGESQSRPVTGRIGVAVSTPLRKQAHFQHGRSLRENL